MSNDLNKVIKEINYLKRKIADLWESKGRTDQEILDLAGEIDNLLNKYDYLMKHSGCAIERNSLRW